MPPNKRQAEAITTRSADAFAEKNTKNLIEFYFDTGDIATIKREKVGTTVTYAVVSLPTGWFVQKTLGDELATWWRTQGAANWSLADATAKVDKNPQTLHYRVTLTGESEGGGRKDGSGTFRFVMG
jgi:hypothetical protein